MEKQLRIAFVGKNKDARMFCARYLKTNHGFDLVTLQDGAIAVIRRLYFGQRPHKLRWEEKLRIYDALYKVDPNIFIGYLESRLKKMTQDIAVPDARYVNELQRLKELGFIFIRVNTPPTKLHYIKSLSMDTNPGAMLYYEWFSPEADNYIKATYSIMHENREATKRILDEIVQKIQKT